MEFFDVVNECGMPTGEVVSRDEAHRDGIRHRTAHVWVIREKSSASEPGRHAGAARAHEVLLQQTRMEKESDRGQ